MKRFISILAVALLVFASAQAKAPKYIFLMFGDGMGVNSIAMTENHASFVAGNPLGFRRMNFRNFPVMGMCDTPAANVLRTGSSEAATALFCGVKTNGGYVGVDADGAPLESFFIKLHNMGYKVGLMSTDPINHATPAATYSHTVSRGDYRAITRELPASGFEFFAGDSFIEHDKVDGNKDTDEFLLGYGYPTYYGKAEFDARDKFLDKTVLVFERNRSVKSYITAQTDENKTYILEDGSGAMNLAQMLDCCLDALGDEKPFILLCEEGEIDHSGHLNCTMGVVDAVYDLENAVDRALKFYEQHSDETLIVVFSDHETGGAALKGLSAKGHLIDWQALIDEWNGPRPKNQYTKDECRRMAAKCGIVWASGGHTSAPTPMFAIGCGAQNFGGCIDNTEFYTRILSLFSNAQ